ncbi:MAG: biotin--[acetyl-CoA-carboxylase] ligase [Proteobacteria bacterium]|nr:biotin--[acetyl-CoA-carboxylase] ligase [Pseudomonadota bacterium]
MIKKNQLLEVLRLFSDAKGNYLSGEEIGKRLKISRTSVWKYIKSLQETGFIIEGKTNIGYKFIFPTDTPLVIDLDTELFKSTIALIETESTNDIAKEFSKKLSENFIVVAEKQTKGRGRRGRQWSSPFGTGLYFSLFLKPNLPVSVIPRLTILAGVAVSEALDKFGVETKLKWPNDIMIGNKKVGGILSEMSLEGNEIDYVILGIGINVHTDYDSFPDDFRDKAGSIRTETGKSISRRELFKEILKNLESRYIEFYDKNGILGEVRYIWEKRAYGLNEEVYITTGEEKENCKILGLKEDGVLLVKTKEGKVKEVFAGEVLF